MVLLQVRGEYRSADTGKSAAKPGAGFEDKKRENTSSGLGGRMITVDEIRRELEKTGFLRGKKEYEEKEDEIIAGQFHRRVHEKITKKGEIMPMKEARTIPVEINSTWIYRARKAELELALKEKYGVNEDLSMLSIKGLRKMISAKRMSGDGSAKPNPARRPPVKPRNDSSPRVESAASDMVLVKSKVLHCMHCGFMMEITGAVFESLRDGGGA